MSPSTVPLARLTTLSLMFVLPLMALPAQGAQSHTPPGGMQTHTPPGGMMIASGHSNSNAHQHGASGRAHARRPGLHAHATTIYTINPAISLTPRPGSEGYRVAVRGSGFAPNSTITVAVDGSPVSADCTANASGSFNSCAFTPPPETGGTHTVTASDGIANSASAIYTASAFARSTISTSAPSSASATNTGNPSVSLSSSAGKVGSNVAVSGSGFASNSSITLAFDGSSLSTDCKAKANGSFSASVRSPSQLRPLGPTP